jgi:hypothetical protein
MAGMTTSATTGRQQRLLPHCADVIRVTEASGAEVTKEELFRARSAVTRAWPPEPAEWVSDREEP